MNQIEARPLSENSLNLEKITPKDLFADWRLKYPLAERIFLLHEEHADPDFERWNILWPEFQYRSIAIQALAREKKGDHIPKLSLKMWNPNDHDRPSSTCILTLSFYPSKDLCNKNCFPMARLEFNGSEIIPDDLIKDTVRYKISNGCRDWIGGIMSEF